MHIKPLVITKGRLRMAEGQPPSFEEETISTRAALTKGTAVCIELQ